MKIEVFVQIEFGANKLTVTCLKMGVDQIEVVLIMSFFLKIITQSTKPNHKFILFTMQRNNSLTAPLQFTSVEEFSVFHDF